MSPALFNGSYMSCRPTGLGVVARDLIHALDPGVVRLLDPLGGDRPGTIAIADGMGPNHGWRGHWRRLRWLQRDGRRLMHQHGASVFLSPLPEAPVLQGVRSVVLAHDLLPLRHPQLTPLLPYHLSYVPLVLHQAERVLCNSEATAREVHQRLHVPIRKLVPIRLGFNPSNLIPLNLPREPFLLVLGSHFPHKNLARVLQALAAIPDPTLQLRLVGQPDHRYTPRLKHLAAELGLAERCHWHSWVSDMERLDLLNRCQALVIVSLWEGFGLPALEAMACGTPVIASRAGALPEVVGDAGLLVDPRNVAAISSAMLSTSQDETWLRNARQRGIARAALFDWTQTARQIEALLKDMA